MISKSCLRIGLAQINCTVGDLSGNLLKIKEFIAQAEGLGVDIVAFPELSITGYPPEDLLLKPKFVEDNLNALKELSGSVGDIAVICGFVDRKAGNLYNAAAVIYKGAIKGAYHKLLLPNYGVFDEKRYFSPGKNPGVFKYGQLIFGVNICEDIWHKDGPAALQARQGAHLVININASPYHMGKLDERKRIVRLHAKENKVYIAYVNLVGGQDELVFDGQSMLVDPKGKIMGAAEWFKEDLLVMDLAVPAAKRRPGKAVITVAHDIPVRDKIRLPVREAGACDEICGVYQALCLGLNDYVKKNGFEKVVMGLSGGIDSALVATLAVDTLGKDNVVGIFMPSRHSSKESEEDARQLAQNLGIKFMITSIEQVYNMYLLVLDKYFAGLARNTAEENLQARIRGNIIMALSNKFGWLVLTTGNKSEMSTGYATLYGDMAGGLALIKDVPKLLVYKLARYCNSKGAVIPERIFTKPPTAELRPNQKDSDTLPPYEELDPILKAYIEEDKGLGDLLALNPDEEKVRKVVSMVDLSEYKRRQSPPGVKITPKAFGRDRRMPVTNKYRG